MSGQGRRRGVAFGLRDRLRPGPVGEQLNNREEDKMDRQLSRLVLSRAGGANTTAYKGYLIRRNPFTDKISIEKDGQHICYAISIEDAKYLIDQLV